MRPVEALRGLPELRADPTPLAWARVGVGLAALIEAVEILPQLRRLSDPALLSLPRLEAVPVLPAAWVPLFVAAWALTAAAFLVGFRTRLAGTVLIVLAGYVLAVDHQLYSNHLYLLTLLTLLLTLAGSGAALSVDSRRGKQSTTIPAWPVLLIRAQVTIVYGFAALAKLNLVFISGLVLRANVQLPGLDRVPPLAFAVAAMLAVAAEAFLAFGFWRRNLRKLAVVVGVGFHLTILVTMRVVPDLITFAVLMSSAYLAFFSAISSGEASRAPGNPGGRVRQA